MKSQKAWEGFGTISKWWFYSLFESQSSVHTNLIPTSYQTRTKLVSTSYQTRTKLKPNLYQNGIKLVPNQYHNFNYDVLSAVISNQVHDGKIQKMKPITSYLFYTRVNMWKGT